MATEQTVQSALFHFELGRGKMVVRWVVVVLGALALSLVYTASQFRGLEKREAIDMAQLARNIARGEGYTTSVIRPLSLWHQRTHRPDHSAQFDSHPDTYNPPLYPLALAALFRLMPAKVFEMKITDLRYSPELWVVVPFNQLCLLLSLLLAYFWARQLFDERVAVTAALLLLFSDTLWAVAISGLPTTFLILQFLAAMYCLFQADRLLHPPEGTAPVPTNARAIGLVVASAVFMGLCFLTRYLAFFLLLPMAIYAGRVMRGRRGLMWAGFYIAIFLAVITPWLVRNFNVSHSLLGVAGYQFFTTEALERTYTVDMEKAWGLRSLVGHFLTNLRHIWIDCFRQIGMDILIFFFAVGVMYGFRRDDAARLRRVVLACLALSMLGAALIGFSTELLTPDLNGDNILVVFLPLVGVFGCAFFYLLLDRISFSMKLTQVAAISLFAVLNVAPIIFSILPPRRPPFPYPPYCPPYTWYLTKWFSKTEIGVSDAPWTVAWYADRRTVWLPLTMEDYLEIHDFIAPHNTQFILLTPYMLDRRYETDLQKGDYKAWTDIIRGKLPDKFPLTAVTLYPPGTDQFLITDRPRWKENQGTNEQDYTFKKLQN